MFGGSNYSGTSPYSHLTSKKTSPLQSPWLSPKLYSTVQITPCNKVTSPLRSLLPSPVGDLISEVPLYYSDCVGCVPLPEYAYLEVTICHTTCLIIQCVNSCTWPVLVNLHRYTDCSCHFSAAAMTVVAVVVTITSAVTIV